METREIRMQFLNGVLQQFSITADIPHFDVVMGVIRARHGPPQEGRGRDRGPLRLLPLA